MNKYDVKYVGHAGKFVELTVEANGMNLLDSIDDSLMTFTAKGQLVLAIPFSSFVSATKIVPPKLTPIKPA